MASSAAASAPFTSTIKALHKAAKRGDRQTLAACIACKDLDLNATFGWFKQSPLHAAVRNGHLQCVQDLLDAGADVQVCDKYGNTPLQTAATRKDTACLKALAAAGALAGFGRYGECETALYIAAKQGHLAGVQALLRCEDAVDAQQTIDSGGLPLHAAARGGHSECFMALLEADKSLINTTVCGGKHQYLHRHTATSGGHSECSLGLPEGDARCCQCIAEMQTPFQLAAADCSLEAIKAGLAAGGLVDVTNEHGEGPSFAAAAGGNTDVLALLVQHTPDSVHQRNAFGTRPLHIAAENGHTACVELLLEAGAEVMAVQDGSGNTALHLAAMGGHADCVLRLLAAHSDSVQLVNLCNARGDSALPMAARRGHTQCVAALLKAGAHQRDGLELAARYGHAGCLEALLLQVNIHAAQFSYAGEVLLLHPNVPYVGATALHWAVQNGHMACVKLILACKASLVDALDANGWLPLFTAVAAGRLELLELLVVGSRQAVGGVTALHLAVCCGHLHCVDKLLELDPTLLDARTDAGNTALHLAAANHSKDFVEYTSPWAVSASPGGKLLVTATPSEIVRSPHARNLHDHLRILVFKRPTLPDDKLACAKLLLARGANVDAANSSGDTPLHCAVAGGTPSAVSALLAEHARADLLNAAGTGVLHIAAGHHKKVVATLIKAGAPRDIAHNGVLPLHLAIDTYTSQGDLCAVCDLLDAGADPDAVAPGHGTPLYMAITSTKLTWSGRRLECVSALLAAGADATLSGAGYGECSALDEAIRLTEPQLVKVLAASCRQFTPSLYPTLPLARLGDTQQAVDTLTHLQLESRWRRRRPLALIREQRRAVRDAGLVHKEWERKQQEAAAAARSKRKK